MPSIRTVKTASGSTAVQVVEYRKRKPVILKHVGSARTTEEIPLLETQAMRWLENYTKQRSLFPPPSTNSVAPYITQWDGRQFVGIRYGLAYEVLSAAYDRMGYVVLDDPLLRDLCVMRLVEPTSKVRSLELLARYFGLVYSERTLYRHLPQFVDCKPQTEQLAAAFAREELKDDLSMVLYYLSKIISYIQPRPFLFRLRLRKGPGEFALVCISMLHDLFDRSFEDMLSSQPFSHPLRFEAVDLKLS